jgi:hypothetical protein
MRSLLTAFLISIPLAFAAPAFTQVRLNVRVGPPAPPKEVVIQAPSPGLVWVPGYYVYNTSSANYVWVPGRWQAPPSAKHVWVAPRYVRSGNHYVYYKGRWHDNGKHKGWYKQKKNRGRGKK